MHRSPALNEHEVTTRWATEEEGEGDERDLTDKKRGQSDHQEPRPAESKNGDDAEAQYREPRRRPDAKPSEHVKTA